MPYESAMSILNFEDIEQPWLFSEATWDLYANADQGTEIYYKMVNEKFQYRLNKNYYVPIQYNFEDAYTRYQLPDCN